MRWLVWCVVGFPLVAFGGAPKDKDPIDFGSRTGKQVRLPKATEDQATKLDQLAQARQLEAIARLEELIRQGQINEQTAAEMNLRLADLYLARARQLHMREIEIITKASDACLEIPGCKLENVRRDHTGSEAWRNKARRRYQHILTKTPHYARADRATYDLGTVLMDLGRHDEGANAFRRLVKVHPDSALVPDALVYLGDYYFNVKEQPFGALKAFKKASSYPDHAKYSYAMYKLGWCYYNLGDYEKAIASMKTVVSHEAEAQAEGTAAGALLLQDEALKDLVRFYADADNVEEAERVFVSWGRKDLVEATMQRLGAILLEQGKFDAAINSYQRLILWDATAAANPAHQIAIVEAHHKVGRRDKVVEEVIRLADDYGTDSSWARHQSDAEIVAGVQDDIERQLRKVGTRLHQTGRQFHRGRRGTEGTALYRLAERTYAAYLDRFAQHERAYDVQFAYGELLYALEDFAGAYEAYRTVVARDPSGKHARFCAEAAIHAAEELVERESGGLAPTGAKPVTVAKAAKPLTEWEQRLVDATHTFAERFPTDPKVQGALYKAAYLLYARYRFDEAAAQFRTVITLDPTSEEASLGAQLILDALAVTERWEALRDTAKAFVELPQLGNRSFKKDVALVYQRASFKFVEAGHKADGDDAKAAAAYVAFAEKFPEADTAAQALHNATVYYRNVADLAGAMAAAQILVDDPRFGPKTKYYEDQLAALGYDYERVADYPKAASTYERLWEVWRQDRADDTAERAADALYSAAVFRKALGEPEVAIANYRTFVQSRPADARVSDVRLRVAGLLEELERWEEAADAYRDFVVRPEEGATQEQDWLARLRLGQSYERLGHDHKRDLVYEETLAAYVPVQDPPPPGAEHLAEMAFTLALKPHNAYLELTIAGANDEALNQALSAKLRSLQALEGEFANVVNIGVAKWGLAALVALGEAYENMGKTLRNSEVPAYLTADQAEIYRQQLEDGAYLQDEKAVGVYEAALAKAHELTLYDTNTAYAIRRLNRLRPEDHPGIAEQLHEAVWTATRGRNFSFEQAL